MTYMTTPPCPVKSAHRRLMDCHEQWHAAADDYMEPDGFRMHVSNLTQNLRNVTWLLQKQKNELPDFACWYGRWQKSVTDDFVMKWIVKSRNRVVKEADLDIHSTARVRLSVDWLNEVDAEWHMPARYRTRDILIRISSTHGLPPVGAISIERRWIDKLLPEWELLDAFTHAYSCLVSVIKLAHETSGITLCDLPARRKSCVTSELTEIPRCMMEPDEARRLHVDLSDRSELNERYLPVIRDEEIVRHARERYGEFAPNGNAIELVPYAASVAQRLFAADKELLTVAWLIRDRKMIDLFPMIFANQTAKRLTMHRLADRVERVGADGVVLLSESWMAQIGPDEDLSDPRTPPAGERPDRMEALQVIGIAKDGEKAEQVVLFRREPDGEIIFDEPIAMEAQNNLIEPLRRKWAQMEESDRNSGPTSFPAPD
jgi:hypothetical protein